MQTISFPAANTRKISSTWEKTLAMIKILYNIIEGLVSVFFGFSDESLALFGSGVDSFAEVISGLGIWQMVRRMRRNDGEATDTCELRKFELLSFRLA